jgi:hypothetical protein
MRGLGRFLGGFVIKGLGVEAENPRSRGFGNGFRASAFTEGGQASVGKAFAPSPALAQL